MISLEKITQVMSRIFLPKSRGTVRFMFPIIVGVLAFLGASVASTDTRSYIELVPSSTTVQSGEMFRIDVFAYAEVPVNALDIEIEFAPDVVEVIGADIGQSVLTVWTQEPRVEGNKIVFGGGTYRRGFIGRHLVTTIEIKALKTGKTEFTLAGAKLLAGDGKGTPVVLSQDTVKNKNSFIIYDQDESPEEISATLGIGINPDIDGDGEVTLKDISSFMTVWYSKEKTFDFNNDAKMNFIDFSIILAKSFTK